MIKVEALKVETWNGMVMQPLCCSCSDSIGTHEIASTNKYNTTIAIQLCTPCLKALATQVKEAERKEEEKTMVTLHAWDYTFAVPFAELEEITVGVFNMTVSEFVDEYTHDNAVLVYQLLQDDEIEVEVALNENENESMDEVYANQEYKIVLHYDHLELVCETSYENQPILTKQELREYAISQFLQYEDFGNINFWELDVTVKLTKLTLVKATEFSLIEEVEAK